MAESEAPQGVDPSVPGEKESKAPPINPSETKGLSRLPTEVKTSLSKADDLVLRLSKLIKTTAGLGAGLGTLNYGIYLAAYLHAVSGPTRVQVITAIQRALGRQPKLPASALAPATSFLTPLGVMIGDVRTTLRLTGLIPLYVLLKSLLDPNSPKRKDTISYNIALVQCLSYITFQAIENVYTLTNKAVIPPDFVAKRGGIPKFVLWSCRAWLVAVVSDFFRLAREAQLHQEKKDKGGVSDSEQKEFDKAWWTSLRTAVAWMPVAIHYSTEGGLGGMNTGIVGFCGMMAYMGNFRNAWAATKE